MQLLRRVVSVCFIFGSAACGSTNSPAQPSFSIANTRTFTGTLAAPVYVTAGGSIGNSDYFAAYAFTGSGVLELTVTSLDPPAPAKAPQSAASGPIGLFLGFVAGGTCSFFPPRTAGDSSTIIGSASSSAQLSQTIQPGTRYCAQISNLSTGPISYALQIRASNDLQILPADVLTGLATVTASTVTPDPSTAGQSVSIALTFGVTQGGTADAIYWNSNFGVFGGPVDAVPPGTITPRSGGPIAPGTTVFLTYATTAPVHAVLNIVTSKQPFTLTNAVPSDGSVYSVFFHVQ